MEPRTWIVFWCLAGAAFSLLIGFGMSLVPPETRRRQLRRIGQAGYDLREDVRSWWLRGVHYGTPAPPAPEPLLVPPARSEPAPFVRVADTPTQVVESLPERPEEPEHAGAVEGWSPAADVTSEAALAPRAAELVRTALDPEAEKILQALDQVVEDSKYFDQEWVAFQASVDQGLVDAGLDPATHRAWRASALVYDTDEYRQISQDQLVAN